MLVFSFNGVTGHLHHKIIKNSVSGEEKCVPLQAHPQVLGGGGDRLSLSVMHTEVV